MSIICEVMITENQTHSIFVCFTKIFNGHIKKAHIHPIQIHLENVDNRHGMNAA